MSIEYIFPPATAEDAHLTREERKAVAEALRQAKAHLWDGQPVDPASPEGPEAAEKEAFICYALLRVPLTYDEQRASGVIERRLGSQSTLLTWARSQGISWGWAEMRGDSAYERAGQAYRHAWVDQLIKEFEA